MRNEDEKQIQKALEYALEKATLAGASDAAVNASISEGRSVTVRMGELDTLEYHKGQSFSITVYKGQKKGSAGTTDLSESEILTAIEAAMGIATYTSEDSFSGLADKTLLAAEFPELDLFHDWEITTDEMISQCKNCESGAMKIDPRINNSEGASLSTYSGSSGYANSNDFLHVSSGSSHSLSCTLIAEDDQGMQRDYWYSSERNPNLLENIEEVGRKAAERTISRLSPRSIASLHCPVVFSPEMSKSMVGHLISAVSGGAQYKKTSFLLNAVGELILPDFMQLYEDPLIIGGSKSSSYDGEGVATKKSGLIVDGVLERYILSSYSARKLDLVTTANAGGMRNIRMTHSDKTQHDLLKEMNRGLLITELIGQGVNPVTGDYSRGASGYWVDRGEIQHPVEGFTVAGNLRDIYKNLIHIGNDTDKRGNIHTGSWMIDNMTIAGQ